MRSRVLAAAFIAAATLAVFASSSAARWLSLSNQNYRVTFQRWDFNVGGMTTECRLTIEGSFHARTYAKVVNSLIGFLTRAIVGNPCIRGSATILTETLPWHVPYRSFTGPLPSITSMITNVSGSAFRIREPFGIVCLASGGIPQLTYTREAGGAISAAAISGTSPTNCEVNGTLSSSGGRLFLLGTTTAISVRLI
jgi:hypothetical protein